MNSFTFAQAPTVAAAIQEKNSQAGASFLGGGTNLVDLMKQDVVRPAHLISLNQLPLAAIVDRTDGGMRLGALATNTDTAYHPAVRQRYPLLSQAILAGASPQLRNAATNGGNLLQRTRCYYFYDVAMPCNKRAPGSGCSAIGGFNRVCGILGTSAQCIATHPSDMCVALAALGATVRVQGPHGERTIAFEDFHRLPGDTPDIDTNLQANDLITAIDLPANGFPQHYTYLKLRDRRSYAFALVSVAVGLTLAGDVIQEARLALGGVAHKPWRDQAAEALLKDQPATEETFRRVADQVVTGAQGYGSNTFKIELAQRAVVRALHQAANMDYPHGGPAFQNS